jgi:hypothetical protein
VLRSAWDVVNELSFSQALLVPAAGLLLGAVAGRLVRKGWKPAAIGGLAGVIGGALVALLTFVLSFVIYEATPPGKGPRAEQGFGDAAPFIAALESHHRAHGDYPATLDELELPSTEMIYERVGPSYTLTFRYAGPGMNTCIYSPRNGWSCSGYY